MTPKEKAKQLFEKFIDEIPANQEKDIAKFMAIDTNCAKQCALIAVNEILNVIESPDDKYSSYGLQLVRSWREVKQEIEKL